MRNIKRIIGNLLVVAISCSPLSAFATQNVVDTNVNLAEVRRYLIDEDFNDYNGGTPAHSVEMINGWGVTTGAVSSTHTNAQDKAIKLSLDDKAAVFRFNKPIQGGKFVVEFDVKHSHGGWGVNLLKERDFLPANYLGKTHWEIKKDSSNNRVVGSSGWLTAQNDYYQEKLTEAKASNPSLNETNWRNTNWETLWDTYRKIAGNVSDMRDVDIKTSLLVGRSDNDTGIGYSSARGNKGQINDTRTGKQANKNAWTHIKVEVDTASAAYKITVGNDDPVVAKLNTSNFASGLQGYTNSSNSFAGSYNTETGRQNWTFGFGGIALRTFNYAGHNASASVEFDNLQVYTENAYNDYETFDKISGQEAAKLQSWYNILGAGPALDPGAGEYYSSGNYYYASEGKDYNAETNPTDKALAYVISTAGDGIIEHQLSVPVKKGKSFEMEFDLKIDNTKFDGTKTGDGTDSSFGFFLIPDGTLYNPQYSDSFNLQNNAFDKSQTEVECAPGSGHTPTWGTAYKNYLLFANSAIADGGTLEEAGKFRFYTGSESDPTGSNGTVAYKDGDESTNLSLSSKAWNHIKLNGRAVSGNKYAVTLTVNDVTSQEYTTAISSTKDIVAVAFRPFKSTSNRRAIHLDNFKVTETGYTKNGVASVNKVTGAGTTVDFSDEFKDTDTSIKVEFETADLTSGDLDYIGVRNITKNAEANITKTLAPDNKTVSITFNTAPDICDELEFYVNKKTQTTGNDTYLNTELTAIEEYSQTFDYLTDDFYVDGIELYRSDDGVDWQLVTASPIANILALTDRFKLIARGYNGTNVTKDVRLANAEYTSEENELQMLINFDSLSIPHGSFEIESTPSLLSGIGSKIKSFFWEYIDGGYKALIRNLDYNITYNAE